jgi:hypothetical protein
MKSPGLVPDTGVDLSDLAKLVTMPAPVATIYLTTDADVENAASRSALRWRAVRDDLASQGAPEEVLVAIDSVVPDAHHAGGCLTVVAGTEGVRLAESHPDAPTRDVGRWAELASLAPLIEWRQTEPAHLVVLVDRQGADLIAYRPRGADLIEEVKGGTHPIHPTSTGGWSQRRHQARVQENWAHNAARVAEEVAQLAKAVEAQLIVVAGDVRARELLMAALPTELAGRTSQISGGRGPDGSEDHVSAEVVREVAAVAAGVTRDVLAEFKEERGQHDRAADGVPATIAALARAQAGLLLVNDDLGHERAAWFGPEPSHIGARRSDLEAMGVAARDIREGRLADVAIRAALGTGAAIRVVPEHGGPSDGIGALLRWS